MGLGWRVLVIASVAMGIFGSEGKSQGLPSPVVTANMSLKDGKSSFRSGEEIVLEISFQTSAAGCFLVSNTTPSSMDHVALTPTEGAFRWVQGDGPSSDASAWTAMEPNRPAVIWIVLNDLYRFDGRGSYSVQVRTSHVHCGAFSVGAPVEVTTNPVTFSVEPFAEAEERELAESLEQGIRSSTDQRQAEQLARQLAYLPGDAATRAKLSLYLHPKTFYPFAVDVSQGLWISRNRAMVISALEQAVADPAVPTGAGLLSQLVALRSNPVNPRNLCCILARRNEANAMMAAYLHQLALSLPQKTGEPRMVAAESVFEADAGASKREQQADFHAAREIVITHFGEINEYSVGTLLSRFGAYLEDQRIIPALRDLIDHSEGTFAGNRTEAIKLMQKIVPACVWVGDRPATPCG